MIQYAIALCLVAMISVIVIMPVWTRIMGASLYFQPIRLEGPVSHIDEKKNTPSMGGVVLCVLWAWLSYTFEMMPHVRLQALWLCAAGFFMLGVYDDVLKIIQKNAYALRMTPKFIIQCCLALVPCVWLILYGQSDVMLRQQLPWYGPVFMPLWCGVPLWMLTIVATSNAVNLADGLDGLATSICLPIFIGLWLCTHYTYFTYAIAALVGVLLGFLWFNSKPASIMMGDSGSLFLGALMGYFACVTEHIAVFIIMALVLVCITLSVILQVGYFKFTGGKRLFKMAPLHHHFELIGMPETQIVARFFLMSVICVMMGFLCHQSFSF